MAGLCSTNRIDCCLNKKDYLAILKRGHMIFQSQTCTYQIVISV